MTDLERILQPLLTAWRLCNKRLGLLRLNTAALVDPERLGTGVPTATNFLAGNSTWLTPGSGGLGDVVGPTGPITANAIVLFDGTTGKLIKDGIVTLSGTGSLAVSGSTSVSGSNSGDQTITLTGDVTGSGTGSFAATIANDAVTNAKAANMAQATIKGRAAGAGTGDPTDLTGTQATAILDVGTSSLQGVAPASGGGTTNFLRADWTWAAPAGGSSPGGSDTHVQFNDAGALGGEAAFAYDKTSNILTVPDLVATGDAQVDGGLNVDGNLSAGGSATIGGPLDVGNGTAGAPAFAFTSDPDLGWFRNAANDMQAAAGGAAIFKVSSSGVSILALGGTRHFLRQNTVGGNVTSSVLTSGDFTANLVPISSLANMTSDRLLGRDTAGSGAVEEVQVGAGIEFSGAGRIQRSALTGDVTASAGSNTTAIAAGVIVNADINSSAAIALSKLATQAANTVVANATGSTAVPTAIALSASELLGRGSTGNVAPIVLGTNLSMSGTTLNASGGSGSPGGSNKEIQYNNSSSFGGISTLTYESGTPGLYFGGLEARWQASGLDTHPWLKVNGAGSTKEIQLGSGTSGTLDVNLYRGGADILTTDDQFVAVGGVVLPTKSGTFADGDFANPVDGLIGVNTSTNKLEFRSGGSWYSTP
jgi:hypothetical protein